MDAFLAALDDLVDTNVEDLSPFEIMGALQLTQQRIALDLLIEEDEDDAE